MFILNLAWQYLYPATLILNSNGSVNVIGGAAYATGGTGFYDPCSDTFGYNLTQGVFNGNFTVDISLSPL